MAGVEGSIIEGKDWKRVVEVPLIHFTPGPKVSVQQAGRGVGFSVRTLPQWHAGVGM